MIENMGCAIDPPVERRRKHLARSASWTPGEVDVWGPALAAGNRPAALGGVPKILPLSRDEYPFASTFEGGAGAWVGHGAPSENQAGGGLLRTLLVEHRLRPGDSFYVRVINYPGSSR